MRVVADQRADAVAELEDVEIADELVGDELNGDGAVGIALDDLVEQTVGVAQQARFFPGVEGRVGLLDHLHGLNELPVGVRSAFLSRSAHG